jgi:NADPH-dependent 2,4-dienoyl-CoA reductase/sulfur reductase-like enzyme
MSGGPQIESPHVIVVGGGLAGLAAAAALAESRCRVTLLAAAVWRPRGVV